MKFMKSLSSLVGLSSLCIALAAGAQESMRLPEGQTLLNLSVTERRQVTADTLVARLRVEGEERDAAALQEHINRRMESALEQANAVAGLQVSTGRYSVYRHQRQPEGGRRETLWRGAQTLELETDSEPTALQELAGQLQAEGFLVSQLEYRLSEQAAEAVRDSLLEAAIERILQRAGRAAAALGKADLDVVELNMDGSGGTSPPIMLRSMTAEADGTRTTPSAQAGESEVTLTVNARVVLR